MIYMERSGKSCFYGQMGYLLQFWVQNSVTEYLGILGSTLQAF